MLEFVNTTKSCFEESDHVGNSAVVLVAVAVFFVELCVLIELKTFPLGDLSSCCCCCCLFVVVVVVVVIYLLLLLLLC
jgi:heme/copper-type cytochrome/quinol oxidase subunit 4